jgi:hypothetical protein
MPQIALPKNRGVLLFNTYADMLDSLFDMLMGLHGQVNWSLVNDSLERCKLARVVGVKEAVANLNFRNLSKFVLAKQPKNAAAECKSILSQLQVNAGAPHSNIVLTGENQESYGIVESAVSAYFLLNDTLLGQALGDENVSKEKSELLNALSSLPQTGRSNLAEFISRLKKRKGDLPVKDSRLLLRSQLKGLLT